MFNRLKLLARRDVIAAAIVAGLIVLTILAFATSPGTSPPIEASTAPPSAAIASSPPTPTPSQAEHDPNEQHYLDALSEDARDGVEDTQLLGEAWQFCVGDPNGYVIEDGRYGGIEYTGPPEVSMLVGNTEDPAYTAAIRYLCPRYRPLIKRAKWLEKNSFEDGTYEVGNGVKPGTYRTDGSAEDCYWERSTRGGEILANDFVGNAPGGVTVTIRTSDGGFKSDNCGTWVQVRRPAS